MYAMAIIINKQKTQQNLETRKQNLHMQPDKADKVKHMHESMSDINWPHYNKPSSKVIFSNSRTPTPGYSGENNVALHVNDPRMLSMSCTGVTLYAIVVRGDEKLMRSTMSPFGSENSTVPVAWNNGSVVTIHVIVRSWPSTGGCGLTVISI